MSLIEVGTDYSVVIEHGVSDQIAAYVGEGVHRALIVYPESMRSLGQRVTTRVRDSGVQAYAAAVPDGESAKDITVASELWRLLGREGFTRTDVVIGVGGGTVTDLAGFVAATWMRGVPVIQVPTTLLAMVDAAVGGKTGINTAEGKNLVGAFHPPQAVLCDLAALRTLPQADHIAGLAEVIKIGLIADPVILELISADPQGATHAEGTAIPELIERSITVKADLVSRDLREASLREILNYGHTFGHAIEQVERYRRRHGEAVSIGMVYAAELSCAAGALDRSVVAQHREILRSVGLPTTYARGRWDELERAMRRDKKSRGAMLRFVILADIATPTRLEGPNEDWLHAAYAAITV